MGKKRIVIKKYDLFYYFVFFLLVKPYSLNVNTVLDFLYNILKLGFLVLLLIKWILRKKDSQSILSILGILFGGIIIISTIIHGGDIYKSFSISMPFVVTTIFFELYHYDITRMIQAFSDMCILYSTINIISILMIKIDHNKLTVYFLGSKNGLTVIIPLFLLLTGVAAYQNGNRRKLNMLLAILTISVALTQSTTMIAEMIAFALLWSLKNTKVAKRIFNYWIIFLGYIVANIVLLSDNLFTKWITFFLGILDQFLDKGKSSMLVRFGMWRRGFSIFRSNWLIGMGAWSEKQWDSLFGGLHYKAQLHNNIVEFLTIGGILLLSIYIITLVIIGIRISQMKSDNISYLTCIACLMIFVSGLTSAVYGGEFVGVLCIGYFIRDTLVSDVVCKSSEQHLKRYISKPYFIS